MIGATGNDDYKFRTGNGNDVIFDGGGDRLMRPSMKYFLSA